MIYESHDIVLTGDEGRRAIKILDDRFWNDVENIYCVPINQLDETVKGQLYEFIPNLMKAGFLIVEVYKSYILNETE